MRDAIISRFEDASAEALDTFVRRCAYHSGDYTATETYALLSERLKQLDQEHSIGGSRIFYLAIPPSLYSTVAGHLGSAGLTSEPESGHPYVHLVVDRKSVV